MRVLTGRCTSFDHIILDGSKSYDPDGKKLTYSWRQLAGGPIVLLSDDQNVKPTFEAPAAYGYRYYFDISINSK